MSSRTLKVYFKKDSDANFDITVNSIKAEIFDNFFSFETDTSFHGSYTITIIVYSGMLNLTRCTATYPAIVNGTQGNITMEQPIKYPIAVVKDKKIETYSFPTTITNKLTYEHLMFNGPSYFVVDTESKDTSLYIGDLLENINENVTRIETVYNYNKKPNDIFSKTDLEELKQLIICKYNET